MVSKLPPYIVPSALHADPIPSICLYPMPSIHCSLCPPYTVPYAPHTLYPCMCQTDFGCYTDVLRFAFETHSHSSLSKRSNCYMTPALSQLQLLEWLHVCLLSILKVAFSSSLSFSPTCLLLASTFRYLPWWNKCILLLS